MRLHKESSLGGTGSSVAPISGHACWHAAREATHDDLSQACPLRHRGWEYLFRLQDLSGAGAERSLATSSARPLKEMALQQIYSPS